MKTYCLKCREVILKNMDMLVVELDLIEEKVFHFKVVDMVKIY